MNLEKMSDELDDEWLKFADEDDDLEETQVDIDLEAKSRNQKIAPEPSDIYISTKTEIAFLNITNIDLYDVFWKIPLIDYDTPSEGVIKKQMKFISQTKEEFDELQANLKKYENNYVEELIISKMKADIGDTKFKDVRKISIGISKKDMITNRTKKKGAFYNCFVIILRVFEEGRFKEYHIKIFNTGKIELPGIQKASSMQLIKKILEQQMFAILSNEEVIAFTERKLKEVGSNQSILINSNFDCNFYLDRQKLFNILKFDYGLNTIYDPCTYPGVRCYFYYENEILDGKQKSAHDKTISFMIFRTGSVLIVGKCSEEELRQIYNFIKELLKREFTKIYSENYVEKKKVTQEKRTKKKILIGE